MRWRDEMVSHQWTASGESLSSSSSSSSSDLPRMHYYYFFFYIWALKEHRSIFMCMKYIGHQSEVMSWYVPWSPRVGTLVSWLAEWVLWCLTKLRRHEFISEQQLKHINMYLSLESLKGWSSDWGIRFSLSLPFSNDTEAVVSNADARSNFSWSKTKSCFCK